MSSTDVYVSPSRVPAAIALLLGLISPAIMIVGVLLMLQIASGTGPSPREDLGGVVFVIGGLVALAGGVTAIVCLVKGLARGVAVIALLVAAVPSVYGVWTLVNVVTGAG